MTGTSIRTVYTHIYTCTLGTLCRNSTGGTSIYLFHTNFLEGILKKLEVTDVLVLESCAKFHFLQGNATCMGRQKIILYRAAGTEVRKGCGM